MLDRHIDARGVLFQGDHFGVESQLEVRIVLAVTLDDCRELVLATVCGEGVFHVAYVEAVVVLAEGFAVDGAVAAPVAHSVDLFDVL